MDLIHLNTKDEAQLHKLRSSYRTFIALQYNHYVAFCWEAVNPELVQGTYIKLADVDAKLLSHSLAKGKDVEDDLKLTTEYAKKVSEIMANHPAAVCPGKQTRCAPPKPFVEQKLPIIIAKDIASWFKFKELFALAPGSDTASDRDKKFKLLEALPASLCIDILSLDYKSAIAKLEKEFESTESLRMFVDKSIEAVPQVKSLNDREGMLTLSEKIELVCSLAYKANLEKETLSVAFRKLPKFAQMTFLNETDSTNLKDFREWLKKRVCL